MTLRLYFLGPPRIERDGQTIEPDTRKATALLAYLAVTGQFQTRDALAALLWPDMDDQHARAALRRTLSSLRAFAGDAALHVSRDGLGVNPDGLWCDVTAFTSAVVETGRHAHSHAPDKPCPDCIARLEAAVALYRDAFLSGFSLRDSAAFDDWQVVAGEGLRRSLTTALAWLVAAHSAAGAFDRAADHARRWLAVDPLREEAHRWLMRLYAWGGARDLALRQYREAVRVLDEELGVEPLPETTALYEAIQENRLERPAPVVAAPPSQAAAPPAAVPAPAAAPLLGRDTAWAELQRAYKDVTAAGRLVAITGEAGIGKTRLAEAFLEWARAGGATTVTATCYEGEADLAYAPFVAALNALLRRPESAARLPAIPAQWLAEAARLAPELAGGAAPPADSGPGAQTRFFAGISEVICHLLSGPVPGVFCLDDAHWADVASLDLLAYLARRLSDLPVLLVVAWSDAAGGAPRLRRLLTEAQRTATGRAVVLTRWRPSDVLGLVAAGAEPSADTAAVAGRLYRETEGLPFFVVEYLNALRANPDSWAMPQSVRDLLAGRLAGAGQTERQLLQAAAVIGGAFDDDILLAASGRSEEEVVGGLERLLEHGLIREAAEAGGVAGDMGYDFSHQQLRSLVYDETTLARRRLLHRRVAAALTARARGEAMASLIGHHYRLGGQEALAADAYRRAGDHARGLFANREALGHYQTALALGHPATAALYEASGDLYTLLGEYSRGLSAYESAAALAGPADLARLEHKLGQLYERRGQWELADSHYAEALSRYQPATAGADIARLCVDRSRVAYHRGDSAGARALAEEALALAAEDAEARAQAHNTLGILARGAGDREAARRHLEESLALAERAEATAVRVAALNNLARLRGAAGDIDAALELLELAIDLCARQGDRHREAALLNQRADWLHRAGREDEAMSSLKAAVAIYAEIGQESGGWQPEIWKLTEW